MQSNTYFAAAVFQLFPAMHDIQLAPQGLRRVMLGTCLKQATCISPPYIRTVAASKPEYALTLRRRSSSSSLQFVTYSWRRCIWRSYFLRCLFSSMRLARSACNTETNHIGLLAKSHPRICPHHMSFSPSLQALVFARQSSYEHAGNCLVQMPCTSTK